MLKSAVFATALVVCSGTAAFAHVTLETQEAPVGSTYKAVLRVPHGCEGKATVAVRVKIPEGVIAVKPMPKPGWELKTVKGKYEKAYELWGEKVTEGVQEVDWSGGKLPDEFYDEFVLRGQLAADLPAGESSTSLCAGMRGWRRDVGSPFPQQGRTRTSSNSRRRASSCCRRNRCRCGAPAAAGAPPFPGRGDGAAYGKKSAGAACLPGKAG